MGDRLADIEARADGGNVSNPVRRDLRDLLAVAKAARAAHEAGEITVTDADTAHEETHLAIPEYAALALDAALANLEGGA